LSVERKGGLRVSVVAEMTRGILKVTTGISGGREDELNSVVIPFAPHTADNT